MAKEKGLVLDTPDNNKKPKKPTGKTIGTKVPITINPEIQEGKRLAEGKEYIITPQTSNRTLGQLKSRMDHVGAAARAELRRRGRTDPDVDQATKILAGKDVDQATSKIKNVPKKKLSLAVHDMIRQKEMEARIRDEIKRRRNKANQARFQKKKRESIQAQKAANHEYLLKHVASRGSSVLHDPIAHAAANEHYLDNEKNIRKQLVDYHKALKQAALRPTSKKYRELRQKSNTYVQSLKPVWGHLSNDYELANMKDAPASWKSSRHRFIKGNALYREIHKLHSRNVDNFNISAQHTEYPFMKSQGTHVRKTSDREFYLEKPNQLPPTSRPSRPATLQDIHHLTKKNPEWFYEQKPQTPPEFDAPEAMAKANETPTAPSLTSKLSGFFGRRGLKEEAVRRISKTITETQHQELVRLINGKRT